MDPDPDHDHGPRPSDVATGSPLPPDTAPGDRPIPADVPADRRHRLDINPTRAVIVSAVSDDGLAWTFDPGVRVGLDHELASKMATAPAAWALDDGRVRLYFGGVDLPTGDARVLSAVSADGLAFDVDPGIRVRNGSGYATDPAVFADGDRLQMYFCSCGERFADRYGEPFIQVARSDDGLAFDVGEAALRQAGVAFGSPEVFRAGEGWLMFVNGLGLHRAGPDLRWSPVVEQPPFGGGASVVPTADGYRLYYSTVVDDRSVIRSAVSADGVRWTVEPGVRLRTRHDCWGVLNGDVLPLPDGRLRMYLNYQWSDGTQVAPFDVDSF